MMRITTAITVSASVLFAAALVIGVFRWLPIENTSLGLDWQTIWGGIRHGNVTFGQTGGSVGGLFTPPWGILLLLPLGFLPFRDSWGVITFISLLALVFSVPRLTDKRLDHAGIVLLVVSFPALRNVADGNLGALVTGGVALSLYAYETSSPVLMFLGLMLATVKFQETWALVLLLLYLMLSRWPVSQWLRVVLFASPVVGASMFLWGGQWLSALLGGASPLGTARWLTSAMGRGSLIDITLSAALRRLGAPEWAVAASWVALLAVTLLVMFVWARVSNQLSRQVAAFLISSSLLLSPYASGNSFLTVLAIGIIPLLQEHRRVGGVMLLLANAPYLAPKGILYYYQSYYWTFMLLASWAVAGYVVLLERSARHPPAPPPLQNRT
jgi:hypothetical protein